MMDLEIMRLANALGRMPGERTAYVGLGKRIAPAQLDPNKRYNKRELMAGVSNPEFLKSARISGTNELTRVLKDGRIVVRYYFTDILEVLPDAGLYFSTGGFNGLSTRRHIRDAVLRWSHVAGLGSMSVRLAPYRDAGETTGNLALITYHSLDGVKHTVNTVFTSACVILANTGELVPDRDLDWHKACAAYTARQTDINRDYHLGTLCDETA